MSPASAPHSADTPVQRHIDSLGSSRNYCGLLAHAASRKVFDFPLLTVWEIPDVRGTSRREPAAIPIDWRDTGDLLCAGKRADESETAFLTRLMHESGGSWPDVLLHFGDPILRASKAGLEPVDWLGRLYHLIDPGGIVTLSMEGVPEGSRQVIQAAAEQLAVDSWGFEGNFLTLRKESSIYCSPHIRVANRSSIFMPETCERTVEAATGRLPLRAGADMLDVGVGDGRFSVHFLREARKRGWNYSGLDVTAEPEMRPKFPELLPFTRFAKNFFSIEPEEERYDAIVLLFVFHAFRYWPLYLYQAFRLLRPGGIVLLSNRTDPFLRWTHGAMTENEKREPSALESPVLTECRRYWHTRDVNGIRLFDQIATATAISACTDAAERLGFEQLDRIEVSAERPYRLFRTDLCPDEGEPALWNVGRVGVSALDGRKLRAAWVNPVVEDTLPENMILTVMRKKT